MAKKNHRCLIPKKLKKESDRILLRFKKMEFCSNEIMAILSLATETVRTKIATSRMLDVLSEEAMAHAIEQGTEATMNPINKDNIGMGG